MVDNSVLVAIQKRHVITLPKDLREHMGVGEGDQVIFDLCSDGSALVHRYIGHRWKKNNNCQRISDGCNQEEKNGKHP